jgi:hypothetical protein
MSMDVASNAVGSMICVPTIPKDTARRAPTGRREEEYDIMLQRNWNTQHHGTRLHGRKDPDQ